VASSAALSGGGGTGIASTTAAAMTPTAMLAPATPVVTGGSATAAAPAPATAHQLHRPQAARAGGMVDPLHFLASLPVGQELYILSPVAVPVAGGGGRTPQARPAGSAVGGKPVVAPGAAPRRPSSLGPGTSGATSSAAARAPLAAPSLSATATPPATVASNVTTAGSSSTPSLGDGATPHTLSASESGSPMPAAAPSSASTDKTTASSDEIGTRAEAPAAASPNGGTARFRAHRPRPLGLLRAATQAAAAAEMGNRDVVAVAPTRGSPKVVSASGTLPPLPISQRTALAVMPTR
jgi:hypothetical protein